MDNETQEQFIQELKDFIDKPCYSYVRNEYNRRIIKKLEELHKAALNDPESLYRVKAGDISGYKSGFELIETLITEFERKGDDKQ